MPELPEVETVRRGLEPVLKGRVIRAVVLRRGDLRRPVPADLEDRVTGHRVLEVGRRAKFLLIRLEGGLSMVMHLGMSGRTIIHENAKSAPPPGRHDHLDLETDGGALVRYCDPRRFGMVDLFEGDDYPPFRGLGPEPLGSAFDADVLLASLRGRKGPIKTVLLDQRVVAGLGNIYVCEALFRAGISPLRPGASLTGGEAARLAPLIKQVLEEAILAGGSSLRDHRRPDGEIGYFQHNFKVYGREGEACPAPDCGEVIRRIRQGGRSTFFCPGCQT